MESSDKNGKDGDCVGHPASSSLDAFCRPFSLAFERSDRPFCFLPCESPRVGEWDLALLPKTLTADVAWDDLGKVGGASFGVIGGMGGGMGTCRGEPDTESTPEREEQVDSLLDKRMGGGGGCFGRTEGRVDEPLLRDWLLSGFGRVAGGEDFK